MNNGDFQNTCKAIREKFETNTIEDKDIDLFSDIISNVLDRADLKAPDSEYEKLWNYMADRYCNNIRMTPLLARMYQICRMYTKYRKRLLTDMDDSSDVLEAEATRVSQYPANFLFSDKDGHIASCWFEDINGIDGIAVVIGEMSPILALLPEEHVEDDAIRFVLDACEKVNAGIDMLDAGSIDILADKGIDVPYINDSSIGVLALDKKGIKANRDRGGASVKIDLASKTVRMDCYTIYSTDFYMTLTGSPVLPQNLEEVHAEDIEFSFDNADSTVQDWLGRIGNEFAIPGSPTLIATKKPVNI